jgi:hypothetical protein
MEGGSQATARYSVLIDKISDKSYSGSSAAKIAVKDLPFRIMRAS